MSEIFALIIIIIIVIAHLILAYYEHKRIRKKKTQLEDFILIQLPGMLDDIAKKNI